MAKTKIKELSLMSKEDRTKKIKELKIEITKSQASIKKSGSSKSREIKKAIARILTLNKSEKDKLKNK